MRQWWHDQRWALLGLMAIYALTTIPFASHTPFNWDAAQFTLGVEHFSVHMHQPHPPGYPLFILLGKFFHLFVAAHTSLVIVSIGFGAVAVIMLYVLGLDLWPERRGLAWWVAVAWLCNPLFWLYRETALTYTVDAAVVITIAWLVWRTVQYRQHRYSVISVVVAAIGAGFRPSLLVLLLPLLAYQAWHHKRNWKFIISLFVTGLSICLAWFIPLVVISGGWSAYRIDSQKLYSSVSTKTSIFAHAPFSNIAQQIQLMSSTLLESWNVILLVSIILLVAVIVAIRQLGWRVYWQTYRSVIWRYVCWVGLWMVPAILLYALVHLGQLGYLLYLLPVGYLALGAGLQWLFDRVHPAWIWGSTVTIIALHALVFIWLRPQYAHPEFIPHNPREHTMQAWAKAMPNLFRMNRHTIAEQDIKHQAYLELLKQYDPAETVIVTGRDITYNSLLNHLPIRNDELFRELSAIAPQYRIIELGQQRDYYLLGYQNTMETVHQSTVTLPVTTHYVIFALDVLPSGLQPDGILVDRQPLPDASQSYYLGIMDRTWHWLGYTIQPASHL